MPYTHLLVEGTNIYPNVLDTNQLSVIRGGSFLLKDAITYIESEFKDQLEAVSTGASSGLFLVKNDEGATLQHDIVHDIVDKLRKHEKFNLLTFIVESCTAKSLKEAKKKLYAQLRFRQLQSITVAPDIAEESSGPSEWGGIRPRPADEKSACITYNTPEEKTVYVTASEKERWNYGWNKKQDYYLDEVNSLNLEKEKEEEKEKYESLKNTLHKYGFMQDLSSIAEHPNYPKLSGKIAVFYADGNDFGKTQRRAINNADANEQVKKQQAFDKQIRTDRSRFLAAALGEMLPHEHSIFPDMETQTDNAQAQKKRHLRFETLLWGGDEMLFVMPAWIGFEFVQFFFQQSKNWTLDGKPLTHSAGLVFCSAKTPIRITRNLAQMIADDIKNNTTGKKVDSWDYMVLESIDYPTHTDYGRFHEERYRDIANSRPDFIAPSDAWPDNSVELKTLIDKQLPTRQLYRIARKLTQLPVEEMLTTHEHGNGWPPPATQSTSDDRKLSLLQQQELRMLQTCDDAEALEKGVEIACELFGLDHKKQQERAWLWIHLLELKDYIAPRRNES